MGSIFNGSEEACDELHDLLKLVAKANIAGSLKTDLIGLTRCYVAAVNGDAFVATDILEEITYDRHEAEEWALEDIAARKDEFTICKQTFELWGGDRGYLSDSPYSPENKENKELQRWNTRLPK